MEINKKSWDKVNIKAVRAMHEVFCLADEVCFNKKCAILSLQR